MITMIKLLRFHFFATLASIALGCACWCSADISLPKYFSDHMVLQQNSTMRVWGKSDPGEKLVVKFDDQNVKVVANAKGNWSANITTGKAGGSYELEIESETNETKVVFSNVLVGEVWICGGQGNMAVPVSETLSAETDIAAAKNFPQIRLFKVNQMSAGNPLNDFSKVDPWYCCSAETVKDFSAIAYFYARELSAKLNVPIGVVQLSSGSVPLESWIANDSLKKNKFDELLQHWSNLEEPNNPNAASSLFNGMVAPLAQTPIGGVVWYHGTANIGRGQQYARLFPLFVNSWRAHFNNNDLPFYFVQPPPFRFEDVAVDALPEIWDAQLKTFNNTPATGLVVTTDLADTQLINNKHKLTIAKRLSSWAFANCYSASSANQPAQNRPEPSNSETEKSQNGTGKEDDTTTKDATQPISTQTRQIRQDATISADPPQQTSVESPQDSQTDNAVKAQTPIVACSGPIFESAKPNGNELILTFRYADSGLKIDANSAHGFTICGADEKFFPATVRIDGNKLVLSHPKIEKPTQARYGWTDTAGPTLTNPSGLPASPFRSDKFNLPSSGIEF